MTDDSGVSIIVVAQHGAQELERLLATFFQQNTCQSVEWLIVDPVGSAAVERVIEPYVTQAFVRYLPEPGLSSTAARNRAARHAQGPYLLFLGDHLVFSADVLPAALARLNQPAVGVVGVRVDDETGGQRAGLRLFWDAQWACHRPESIRFANAAEAKALPSGVVPAVDGAFLLCRQADFAALGGFCEDYAEDLLAAVDFCLLLRTRRDKTCYGLNTVALQQADRSAGEILATDAALFRRRMGARMKTLLLANQACVANIKPVPSHSRLNVLFVLPDSLESKCRYEALAVAEHLGRLGVDSVLAVAEPSSMFQGPVPERSFADLQHGEVGFPDGREPDILHAWTPRENVRKFCVALRQRYGCKLFVHLTENEEYLTEVVTGRTWRELSELSVRELDRIISEHSFHPLHGPMWLAQADGLTLAIETLARFNPSGLPSLILPPLADERLFYPRPVNMALRQKLGIPDDYTVLICTDGVHAINREAMNALYQAVAQLNQQGCPTTLVRTGRDAMDWASWPKQQVRYLGETARQELPEILAMADILVQPGAPGPLDDQRLPSALLEYFAMGRPVILPRTNLGLKVEHGRQAWVLDVADAESIAEAVQQLMADRVLRQRLAVGVAAFHRIQVNSSRLAEALLTFYGVASSAPLAHVQAGR